MANNIHAGINDNSRLVRPRLKNGSIQLICDQIRDLQTIDFEESACLTERLQASGDISRCPNISLPLSLMKELEIALTKIPPKIVKVDRRLHNRDKRRSVDLDRRSYSPDIQQKLPQKATVEQIVNNLNQKRKARKVKNLSIELYSRMVDSLNNNYRSLRKNFEKREGDASHSSLNMFELNQKPSTFISHYVPFTVPSDQNPSNKIKPQSVSIVSPKKRQQSFIKPQNLVLQVKGQQNTIKKEIKAHRRRVTSYYDYRLRNEQSQKVKIRLPKIKVIEEESILHNKRNFTPWRRVSQTDEDLSHFI